MHRQTTCSQPHTCTHITLHTNTRHGRPPRTRTRTQTRTRTRAAHSVATMHQVVVVGAGILGASISRHLSLRGAHVSVLEAAPAPAAGATGKSWAWLNANAKTPVHYRDLNLASMRLWQHDHPGLATFNGCLMLHDERGGSDASYPSQAVAAGGELHAAEPALDPQLVQRCVHARVYAQEGWCDPAEATAAFLHDAQQAGARVAYGHQVTSLDVKDGRVTGAACSVSGTADPQQQQRFAADAVVLAAGVGVPDLASQLGYELPLLHKPAAIVLTRALQPGLLRHMLVTDTVFILQRRCGRCLLGETQPSATANTDTSSANAQRILGLAAAAVPALVGVAMEGVHVGMRPYPADGHPVLGWLPGPGGSGCSNAYVAVSHSGMTLAPLIGQLVADEVMAQLSGQQLADSTQQLLAPYRPQRDFKAAAAAAASAPGLNWASTLQPSK